MAAARGPPGARLWAAALRGNANGRPLTQVPAAAMRRAARPPSLCGSEDEEPLSSSFPAARRGSRGGEEEEGPGSISNAASRWAVSRKVDDFEIAEGNEQSPLKDNLSPWEEWFIEKEKELRARLRARAAEEMNIQLEKMKQREEFERRKRIGEEKHREWMQKKREEERRERERKLSKEMAEKATRELEKMQLQEKAEVKYNEWLKKKRAEESEKKKKEKEKEKERQAELQEKKERAEKIFNEWLRDAKNKPRPVLNGYGFPHGKSTGRPDGNSYPAPAYCNPIPWEPLHIPPPKEESVLTMKNSGIIFSPPNFLWKGLSCLLNQRTRFIWREIFGRAVSTPDTNFTGRFL
ncbi:coiled-coil domain-containing protein 34 isoform X4 [Numida meleagris]|uniref:coiled-coil domain-containing protein 34 isoform X4 n=1 Tax=Numida meleagris TaxID=8996 RepID=UPI000B3DDE08|nr:coiled-coil domain-containing protein 34 isoform X4 [Numida meleagris]